MAYIRWGHELASGKRSTSFVFGGPDGLVNMDKGGRIPYQELRELFRTKTDDEIKTELGRRLELQVEEADVVCEGLFYERDRGEWEPQT